MKVTEKKFINLHQNFGPLSTSNQLGALQQQQQQQSQPLLNNNNLLKAFEAAAATAAAVTPVTAVTGMQVEPADKSCEKLLVRTH